MKRPITLSSLLSRRVEVLRTCQLPFLGSIDREKVNRPPGPSFFAPVEKLAEKAIIKLMAK